MVNLHPPFLDVAGTFGETLPITLGDFFWSNVYESEIGLFFSMKACINALGGDCLL